MKTHTLRAGQFIEFINPWKEWNTVWNDVNYGNTNEMNMWPSQWIAILSNCEIARKKVFRDFNGIRTRGLCVSAAVLYQPELWRPIHWEPANLLSSSTRERNETQNEMMWTAGIQMKWNPEKLFFGLFRNCLNCDSLRWSHIHFICIPAVHIISFCVSFLSRVDELNKLAGSQYMGLHSSGW